MPDAKQWTISNLSTALTHLASDWNIDMGSVRREISSMRIDTFSFSQIVPFDQDLDFRRTLTLQDTVQVFKGDVPVFYGIVDTVQRSGEPGRERIDTTLVGPWWYFENLTFQHAWFIRDSTTARKLTNKSRIILGQQLEGSAGSPSTTITRIPTGRVIEAIIDYVIAIGAPFLKGRQMRGVLIPFSEITDQSCAELVRDLIRWTPDTVIQFDYSTTPPTLNVMERGQQTNNIILKTIGSDGLSSFNANPRYDLQLPGIRIIYETTVLDGNQERNDVVIDEAGNPNGFRTVVMTVQLGGGTTTYQTQQVTLTNLDARNFGWWAGKVPWLTRPDIRGPDGTGTPLIGGLSVSSITHKGGGAVGSSPAATELTAGDIPPWLNTHFFPLVASSTVDYSQLTNVDGTVVAVYKQAALEMGFVGTDFPGGGTVVYSRVTSDTPAEFPPLTDPETGESPAHTIFKSFQTLHYDGQMIIEKEECDCDMVVGQTVNILGGRTEWTQMLAVIQKIEEDIGAGRTTVSVGPPNHLGPQDFIELMRMQRHRSPAFKLQERQDAIARAGSSVTGSGGGPNDSPSSPPTGIPTKLILRDDPILSQIILDIQLIKDQLKNLDDPHMKPREFDACSNGKKKKVILLASAFYDPPP
jgi:hypothetical protein